MEIANEVHRLVNMCLNGTADGALVVDGIMRKFGFSAAKVAENREAIRTLLDELPAEFHKSGGGGMSFLNMPMDKHGNQWGEQSTAEALYALGSAAGMAKFCLPRAFWSSLPGGVPYIVVDTTAKS